MRSQARVLICNIDPDATSSTLRLRRRVKYRYLSYVFVILGEWQVQNRHGPRGGGKHPHTVLRFISRLLTALTQHGPRKTLNAHQSWKCPTSTSSCHAADDAAQGRPVAYTTPNCQRVLQPTSIKPRQSVDYRRDSDKSRCDGPQQCSRNLDR